MTRYFFDFYDGEMRRDTVGHEFGGPADIRKEAMRALPEMAQDHVPGGGDKQAYGVLVRDERNVTVYTATLTFAGVWLGEDELRREEEA